MSPICWNAARHLYICPRQECGDRSRSSPGIDATHRHWEPHQSHVLGCGMNSLVGVRNKQLRRDGFLRGLQIMGMSHPVKLAIRHQSTHSRVRLIRTRITPSLHRSPIAVLHYSSSPVPLLREDAQAVGRQGVRAVVNSLLCILCLKNLSIWRECSHGIIVLQVTTPLSAMGPVQLHS